MAELVRSDSLRGLIWVLLAVAFSVVPHLPHLPPWIVLLVLASATWRWIALTRGWRLPSRWLRAAVVIVATLAVLASYRTLNGIDAGTALLVLMAGVKLLETRSARDLTVLVFIAWFLLFAALLRDQGIARLPLMLATATFATAALMRVHAGGVGDSVPELLRRTGALMLQALPLAVVLFVLVPRLPGPFWGLAASSTGRTGLSDEMTAGDVSELSISGEIAFRVRFEGPLPPPPQRYWRGPVLQDFDGRTWRRAQSEHRPRTAPGTSGPPIRYRITQEPHDRHWIFALDLPSRWSPREATLSPDLQLVSPRPLREVASFALESHPLYRAGVTLPDGERRIALALPPGRNARTRALARELAQSHPQPPALIDAALQRFRDLDFVYTLRPPQLNEDPVDEFLFETRRGFCEHYASSFAVLMRAAGIPARVVTGYQGGEFNPLGDYLLVRQSDAHAWTEVWLAGRGWVRIDPTAAIAPERIERGSSDELTAFDTAASRWMFESRWLGGLDLAWDSVNDFWNERIVRYDSARQAALLQRLGMDAGDWRSLGLALTGSIATFFLGLTAWLAWKHRTPRDDWPARLHRQAEARLARRGLARGPAEGPVRFLERAMAAEPPLALRLAEIRTLYVALRYGPAPRQADLRRLKFLVNGL